MQIFVCDVIRSFRHEAFQKPYAFVPVKSRGSWDVPFCEADQEANARSI